MKPSYWLRIPALTKLLASVCRILSTACAKCIRIGTWVVAMFNLWKKGFAFRVHSNITSCNRPNFSDYFICSDIGIDTITYFLVNQWYMIVNPRGTCTSLMDSRVGLSSITSVKWMVSLWFCECLGVVGGESKGDQLPELTAPMQWPAGAPGQTGKPSARSWKGWWQPAE